MARAPECPARPANAARSRGGELAAIARHAAVVLAGQLAAVAFGLADTLIAGRYSQDALAALSVSVAVYVTVQVGLMGLLQALLPVWAELRGAGRLRHLGQSVRQSLYLLAAASALGMAVLLMPGPLLDAAQVPEALQAEARRYLAVQAWALPPALFFRLYSTLNQSLGQPRLVTALQIGAVLPKAALSAWFTFGGLGVPAQGAAGCAWATLAVYAGLMLAAAAALLPAVAAYHLGDALQAASLFALRSYRITTLPFVIYAVLLWGLGLPAGHALAFTGLGPWPAWRSPLAFWCAIALAQGLAGQTLAATLWRAALKKR